MERTRCPACGGGAVDTLLSRDFAHPSVWPWIRDRYAERVSRRELAGRRHEIARCGLCRLLFQRYVLADASLVRLYDVWTSERQDADRDGLPGASAAPAPHGCAPRLLDLGAGDGHFCESAREHGWDVVAIEIAPRRLERLRDRDVEAHARVEDVGDEALHLVRCHDILEHLPQPLDTLRALATRLAPGGRIEIRVPDAERMAPRLPCSFWSAADDALRPLEHVNGFTPRTLGHVASALGLTCVTPTPPIDRMRRARPLQAALVRPGAEGASS